MDETAGTARWMWTLFEPVQAGSSFTLEASGACVAAGVGGCGELVLRCGLELRREDLQPIRGWTDEQWDQARSRLARRGWVSPEGELTDAGRDGHRGVEEATDTAATGPWARLGAA